MLIFLYFQKAIRAKLEGLHGAAVRVATERSDDVGALTERCRFFFTIYKHHCDAEDAVIFPALVIQVKNVARTYFLEHKGESDLFTQLFALPQLDVQNYDSQYFSAFLIQDSTLLPSNSGKFSLGPFAKFLR